MYRNGNVCQIIELDYLIGFFLGTLGLVEEKTLATVFVFLSGGWL